MPVADPGFGQGWPKLPRLKVADVAEWSKLSATEVQGLLKGPGSFWVFIAQIYILPHSRDSFSLTFDIYFNTKR